MYEFGYNAVQTLTPGSAAILENLWVPGCRGARNVLHENLSPVINLRGSVTNPCQQFAEYDVKFECNFAISEGGTVGEIQIAFAQEGQVLPLTISSATPAAVGDYWHASGEKTFHIPVGCCPSITVVNASDGTSVDIRNLNVTVQRTA